MSTFAITANGLKPLTKKMALPLLANRLYPMGASSSPENVYITRVTEGRVYYVGYPYLGEGRGEQLWIFQSLVQEGLATKIKQLAEMLDHPIFKDCDWIPQQLADYKNLLNGENTLPELRQSDFEPLQVVAVKHPDYNPENPREGFYYVCEQYGSTSTNDDDTKCWVETTRGKFREMVQEPSVLIESVKTGSRYAK